MPSSTQHQHTPSGLTGMPPNFSLLSSLPTQHISPLRPEPSPISSLPQPPLLPQPSSRLQQSSSPSDAGSPTLSSPLTSSTLLTSSILPDENESRPVNTGDSEQDGFYGISGDGDGEEWDVEEDGSIEKDPAEARPPDSENVTTSDSAPATKEKKTRLPPAWLMELFKQHVHHLQEGKRDGRPNLYFESGSFWLPRKCNYFLLRPDASVKASIKPSDLFNPRFFYWDPMCFTDIACPLCGKDLVRNGFPSYPRRCVDVDDLFYIIGHRYQCSRCTGDGKPSKRHHKVSADGTSRRSFMSYDSRILSQLPEDLAREFPAVLTWRSGLSICALRLMRASFQQGLGAKQFSNILRVLARLRHDDQRLQYLESIHSYESSSVLSFFRQQGLSANRPTYEYFGEFDDKDVGQRAGFVPSSYWLREVYDQFIEKHAGELDQKTSMLSALVCAIDHSHKVCGFLSALYGSPSHADVLLSPDHQTYCQDWWR